MLRLLHSTHSIKLTFQTFSRVEIRAHFETSQTTYHRILKANIQLAKRNYHETISLKFRNDIKQTWTVIKDIINRSSKILFKVVLNLGVTFNVQYKIYEPSRSFCTTY